MKIGITLQESVKKQAEINIEVKIRIASDGE